MTTERAIPPLSPVLRDRVPAEHGVHFAIDALPYLNLTAKPISGRDPDTENYRPAGCGTALTAP